MITLVSLTASLCATYALVTYGNKLIVEYYTKNVLGWKTTWVGTRIIFAYNWTDQSFVTQFPYTYITNYADKAWWCPSCYAYIKWDTTSTSSSFIMSEVSWAQGSYNVNFDGYHHVYLYTTINPGTLELDVWQYVNGNAKNPLHQFVSIPLSISLNFRLA